MTPRLLCLLLASGAAPASADLVASTPAGFEVQHRVTVAAAPAAVWPVLTDPARWWSPAHTYSGDARNLSFDLRPGGCFCERLPEGGVEHLRVVQVRMREQLRLAGALGPLQGDGVAGALTLSLRPSGKGTEIVLRYIVGGWRPGGMESIGTAVDKVLGEQLARLAATVR